MTWDPKSSSGSTPGPWACQLRRSRWFLISTLPTAACGARTTGDLLRTFAAFVRARCSFLTFGCRTFNEGLDRETLYDYLLLRGVLGSGTVLEGAGA